MTEGGSTTTKWQPGDQVVYVRSPNYIPRDEMPSGSTGSKKVYLDRVIGDRK
jgi:peptide/nickel transport system substrate-binding protein